MHWQMRPLVRLVHAVDHIDLTGSNVAPMKIRAGAPEIQSLIESFERLQTRLAQLIRGRVALLGGISHDARTFATRLRLALDNMEESAERDRAIVDIADMIRLLDDALLASRSIADELAVELFEVSDVVQSEVKEQQAASGKVSLHVSADAADLAILGDRLAFRRVISNLVENALKYGQAAHVSVSRPDPKTISLVVDDEGRGVPVDMRDMLFEPFVRIEGSRSRHTGGAGLGLAVVRNLVEAHQGTIFVGDAPGGGARFIVNLPVFFAKAKV
jgi:signal transduction histidine kinase